MKILCVSDIHGSLDSLIDVRNYLVKNGVHTVFLMGDYSVGFKDLRQNRVDAEYALDSLKNNATLYALPGNCDDPNLVDLFEKRGANLHEKVVVLDGVSFAGLGGCNTSPFGTPCEYTEEQIYEKLDRLFGGVKTEKTVLVVHFPPKDTNCDVIPNGMHVGSVSLRKIIEEKQPDLCICSHIHECGGREDTIGKTRILNVGPLTHGNIAVIDTRDLSVVHGVLELE
ncbi:MAG: metallophosphoesterase [Candidatus Altiarchaeales archaeon]|nr:metallophosphoesterase [Candidatus Altiarchaeales archaeon]